MFLGQDWHAMIMRSKTLNTNDAHTKAYSQVCLVAIFVLEKLPSSLKSVLCQDVPICGSARDKYAAHMYVRCASSANQRTKYYR